MLYCAFVTPGSYCVLEDTKLSRYSANGPLEAAFKYTQRYPNDFVIDRERELIFTHHANGWVCRAVAARGTQGQELAAGGHQCVDLPGGHQWWVCCAAAVQVLAPRQGGPGAAGVQRDSAKLMMHHHLVQLAPSASH